MAKELASDELVVSFLNLPNYTDDGEILQKLRGWGVEAISPIKRRMWPGTDVADGTRFCKVKFSETVKSLPYSTKFDTMEGIKFFRVIHDRQVKVCRLCVQPGHIVRECPDFTCFKCGMQGHYARECANYCSKCSKILEDCACSVEGEVDANRFQGSERICESPVVEEVVEGEVTVESEVRISQPTPEVLDVLVDKEREQTTIGSSLDDVLPTPEAEKPETATRLQNWPGLSQKSVCLQEELAAPAGGLKKPSASLLRPWVSGGRVEMKQAVNDEKSGSIPGDEAQEASKGLDEDSDVDDEMDCEIAKILARRKRAGRMTEKAVGVRTRGGKVKKKTV